MFQVFMSAALGMLIIGAVASFMVGGISPMIPILGVIWALSAVCSGLAKGGAK